MELILYAGVHGTDVVSLYPETGNEPFEIPSGKALIYNNDNYHFGVRGLPEQVTSISINDESYETVQVTGGASPIFMLKHTPKPFLQSFGAVRLRVTTGERAYLTKSITVMVRKTDLNNDVMQMLCYIGDHSDAYLYAAPQDDTKRNGKDGDALTGGMQAVEEKLEMLDSLCGTFRSAYQYLRRSPHTKLQAYEVMAPFSQLQTVTQSTLRGAVQHSDQLRPVGYDTGIRFQKQFYEPARAVTVFRKHSANTYENQAIVGFLYTAAREISVMARNISSRAYLKDRSNAAEGYVDSMHRIFSPGVDRLRQRLQRLSKLKQDFRELYCSFAALFGIHPPALRRLPECTQIFRTQNAYRQIYEAMQQWFYGIHLNPDIDDLLMRFVSSSQIYEYYCLIKLLRYLEYQSGLSYHSAARYLYVIPNLYYSNTKYNNTFVFVGNGLRLTLYFQPVIYGNAAALNGIGLFRNTTTQSRTENAEYKGSTYTPDYLLKIEYLEEDRCVYRILDAKFITPENVRKQHLQALIYKYLFSISPLREQDTLEGLTVICGKAAESEPQAVHDIAERLGIRVKPYAEIVTMTGQEPESAAAERILAKGLTEKQGEIPVNAVAEKAEVYRVRT